MVRTPSQKSAEEKEASQKSKEEKEAIEMLLLMSSPGHASGSHNFPQPNNRAPQQSPLRAEFGQVPPGSQERHVGFTGLDGGDDSTESEYSGPASSLPTRDARRKEDDDIDRMLDAMPDTSSEDELEAPLTPRRIVVGHV
jgi:hypothetical protein